jgi:hypothetical protein
MKYSADSLHIQGTSSKRDLIGGFIERWLNKLAETSVFDSLLENKTYKAIPDYFLYNNDSDKNAPDILGLKTQKGIIPFVEYNNGRWDSIKNYPRIEVKALRKDQYLLGVRDTQMIDDFYVFVESDLSPDYLTSIFDDSVFDKKILNEIICDPVFIRSDINKSIISHLHPTKAQSVGSFRLIGIYTKSQLQLNTTMCLDGVNPWYLKSVTNVERVTSQNSDSVISVASRKFIYNYNNQLYLPMCIEGDTRSTRIVKTNKGSCYLHSDSRLIIDGTILNPGYIKITFNEFQRSSGWNENLATKNFFEKMTQDSTAQLIQKFDEIVTE